MLPHAFPFRLLDREPRSDGLPRFQVTTDAALLRDGAALPPMIAVEMMAQAALQQLRGSDQGGPQDGLLAGLEAVELRAPLRAGDRLEASAVLLARLGKVIKARVELRRAGEIVVTGELLLALSTG